MIFLLQKISSFQGNKFFRKNIIFLKTIEKEDVRPVVGVFSTGLMNLDNDEDVLEVRAD